MKLINLFSAKHSGDIRNLTKMVEASHRRYQTFKKYFPNRAQAIITPLCVDQNY